MATEPTRGDYGQDARSPLRPAAALVRLGVLKEWLGGYGIAGREVMRMIEAGMISTRRTREGARGLYLVSEVEERVLGPLLKETGK